MPLGRRPYAGVSNGEPVDVFEADREALVVMSGMQVSAAQVVLEFARRQARPARSLESELHRQPGRRCWLCGLLARGHRDDWSSRSSVISRALGARAPLGADSDAASSVAQARRDLPPARGCPFDRPLVLNPETNRLYGRRTGDGQ